MNAKHLKHQLLIISLAAISLVSCKKESSDLEESNDSTIAVAATLTASGTVAPGDSIYVMQRCERGSTRQSITASALPQSVTDYLNTNYAGNVFSKAFAIKDAAGTTTNYVVVIYFNTKPVALQFDAAGSFQRVLEQREKRSLQGGGHHRGGRFEERGRLGRDTISLTSLSSSITSYISANYSGDTLIKAYRNCDSSIVVLSKNNGLFATVFTSTGSFISRNQLIDRSNRFNEITESALLPQITSYLAATYPNYVFKKAFKKTNTAGATTGFVVFIDANATKYAVEFNDSGTFVRVKIVH
jgi:hypothetical protein